MKAMLGALCLMAAAAVASAPGSAEAESVAPKRACLEVVPGQSLGPVKLGMTREALGRLGLPVEAGPVEGQWKVGAFTAVTDAEGKVAAVWRELSGQGAPPCLAHGQRRVEVQPDAEAIAAALGACGPVDVREGGNTIDCFAGAAGLGFGLDTATQTPWMRVSVDAGPLKEVPKCGAYVTPDGRVVDGAGFMAVKAGKPVETFEVEIRPERALCVGDQVLDAKLMPARWNQMARTTCKTQANRGGTIVTCDGGRLELRFAGPPATLSQVVVRRMPGR